MDEIRVITLYDEESDTQREFELVGSCETDGQTYWMIAEMAEDEVPGLEELDEDEDEDESTAYLFRLCGREEAEFTAIEGKEEQYITSMMSDEEYDKVARIFMQSDEYDIEIEEEEV